MKVGGIDVIEGNLSTPNETPLSHPRSNTVNAKNETPQEKLISNSNEQNTTINFAESIQNNTNNMFASMMSPQSLHE